MKFVTDVRGRMLGPCSFAESEVNTHLTELNRANLHNETTACDHVRLARLRVVVGKLQCNVGVRPDILFVTKRLSHTHASPTLVD